MIRLLVILMLVTQALLGQAPQAPLPPPPASVVIVANAGDPESLALARYYAEKRGIPEENIAALPMVGAENIDWSVYVSQIYNPLRRWLQEHEWIDDSGIDTVDALGRVGGPLVGGRHKVGYLVLCKGVPLRIKQDENMTTPAAEAAFVQTLGPQGEQVKSSPAFNQHLFKGYASVDSELSAMFFPGNLLGGMLPNPLFRQQDPRVPEGALVLKVARLDGLTFRDARSLVDGALTAERLGLRGRAYIDAGGPYALGNQWLQTLEDALNQLQWDVTVDRVKTRFPPEQRFDAPAIYFGWHSPNIEGPFLEPGFRFPPGAVAVHLHSFSASTMRADGKGWTSPLVGRGAAATIGNVYEPTLGFTHNLDLLGVCVLSGWSWGDAAWCAMPVLSWQGVVVGDPLYVPLKFTLEEQLRHLGDFENLTLGQYPAIRAMRLMEANGQRADAIERGKKAFMETPGLALAVELARMEQAAGNLDAAVDQLRFIENLTILSTDDRGVVLDAAKLLTSWGKPERGLALLEMLRKLGGGSEAFQKAVVEAGYAVATAAGDIEAMSHWRPELPAAKAGP